MKNIIIKYQLYILVSLSFVFILVMAIASLLPISYFVIGIPILLVQCIIVWIVINHDEEIKKESHNDIAND